jgi:hypothetical protein
MIPDSAACHIRPVPMADMGAIELDAPDGSLHLAHPVTGFTYRLNASSAFIWSSLQKESRFAALAERLASEFDIPEGEAACALEGFAEQMGSLGFVTVDDGRPATRLRTRYLNLLKAALVNAIYPEHELRIELLEREGPGPDIQRRMRDIRYSEAQRFRDLLAHKADGRNWRRRVTRFSHTMVGLRRLQNLEWCAARIFAEGIEGDFLEAGVCQGGASIFMRALQVAHDEGHRSMWVADSFEGLPEPESEHDQGYDFHEAVQPWLAVGLETVKDNFRTYDLLSDKVRFLPGWFSETLPEAPVESLALLRIDADLYLSTRQVLEGLYEKIAPGGFVVVDDYRAFPPCRRAVDEFRKARGIAEPLVRIDWTAVFWRKG